MFVFLFRLISLVVRGIRFNHVAMFMFQVVGSPSHSILVINLSSLSHLGPLTSEVVGAPQMTLQQYLSTIPCLPLASGNLEPHSRQFLDVIFPSLLMSSSSSCFFHCPLHCILDSVANVLVCHSHGLCRKYSEVSYSISSHGLGSFSRFLLPRSRSHRHKGRQTR